MAKKTRMGRPPKAPDKKHSEVLYLKLTPEQRAQLESGAKTAGKPLTIWARDILLRASKRAK